MFPANQPTATGARAGAVQLWKVWWLWGIPVGWTASGMIIFAEFIRDAGY